MFHKKRIQNEHYLAKYVDVNRRAGFADFWTFNEALASIDDDFNLTLNFST